MTAPLCRFARTTSSSIAFTSSSSGPSIASTLPPSRATRIVAGSIVARHGPDGSAQRSRSVQ